MQKKKVTDITVSRLYEVAGVNRSTFYANYNEMGDLIRDVRASLVEKIRSWFLHDSTQTVEEKMFLLFKIHIEHKDFFRAYSKLDLTESYALFGDITALPARSFGTKNADYHIEFFKASISAVFRKWAANGYKETPEKMLQIVKDEYATSE